MRCRGRRVATDEPVRDAAVVARCRLIDLQLGAAGGSVRGQSDGGGVGRAGGRPGRPSAVARRPSASSDACAERVWRASETIDPASAARWSTGPTAGHARQLRAAVPRRPATEARRTTTMLWASTEAPQPAARALRHTVADRGAAGPGRLGEAGCRRGPGVRGRTASLRGPMTRSRARAAASARSGQVGGPESSRQNEARRQSAAGPPDCRRTWPIIGSSCALVGSGVLPDVAGGDQAARHAAGPDRPGRAASCALAALGYLPGCNASGFRSHGPPRSGAALPLRVCALLSRRRARRRRRPHRPLRRPHPRAAQPRRPS